MDVLRPGFAFGKPEPGRMPKKLLKGRSAHIVVTMGMPALFYRIVYRAHSVIGMVEGAEKARAAWLAKMAVLGRKAG